MLSAFAYGQAGLRAADMRASARASNIVNWQSTNYQPVEPEQTTGASGEPVVKITRTQLSSDFPYANLAGDIVDLQSAKRAYQASAAVIRTDDDMSKTLLDTIA